MAMGQKRLFITLWVHGRTKRLRSPRRRLTRVRMTIPSEMMVGILLIGDVVDIVEFGRQDS